MGHSLAHSLTSHIRTFKDGVISVAFLQEISHLQPGWSSTNNAVVMVNVGVRGHGRGQRGQQQYTWGGQEEAQGQGHSTGYQDSDRAVAECHLFLVCNTQMPFFKKLTLCPFCHAIKPHVTTHTICTWLMKTKITKEMKNTKQTKSHTHTTTKN